jgi:hypothetical protein
MKRIIGMGALVAVFLVFASEANAGIFGRCRRTCEPMPQCPPAVAATVPGTTSYSSTYQPSASALPAAAPVERMTRTESAWPQWEQERRRAKGL